MKHAFALPSGPSVFWLLACASTIAAHTWVEQLSVIASNGTFVGTPGYPRGFSPRTGTVNPNTAMVYQLPPDGRSTGNAILTSDLMCKGSQTVGTQTPGSPALIASPGDQIALRYQENGHVTNPQVPRGRPEGSGTVFVYGTENPANTDTYLGIHRVWNTAGTGGDKRGVLLATRPFDDGQCYQNNSFPISQARREEFPHEENSLMGPDLWCQTDVQVPTTASGNYTMYWVWEWPLLDATSGEVTSNESYTTCMDIVINPSKGNAKAEAVSFVKGQDINYAAIAAQMSTQILVNPTAAEQRFVSGSAPAPFTGSVGTASSVASAQSSAATTQHSSAAGGFITVTVTADAAAETVTVTKTVAGGASQATPTPAKSTPEAQTSTHSTEVATSTVTISPLPSTSKPSGAASSSTKISAPASQATGSAPPIVPFLSPASQIAKAPAQASTLVTSQAPSPTSKSNTVQGSAAATSDCPDMTPGVSSSATPTSSRTLTPNQSAASYLNGTLHNPPLRLRGRIVRS